MYLWLHLLIFIVSFFSVTETGYDYEPFVIWGTFQAVLLVHLKITKEKGSWCPAKEEPAQAQGWLVSNGNSD